MISALHKFLLLALAFGIWQPLQLHCSALNAAQHRHTSHEWKYLRESDNVTSDPKHAAALFLESASWFLVWFGFLL